MNEILTTRQRRTELLITVSFTIFSVLMIAVTTFAKWPIFLVPLNGFEIAYIWWSYAVQFKYYRFRAFAVAGLTCLNIAIYGIYGENFFVLIPTLCVEFVLLSLFEYPRIMDITIVQTAFLFVYHIWIKKSIVFPSNALERGRLVLQLVSLLVLMALCIYRMHTHAQEEADIRQLEEKVDKEQIIKEDFMANTSHELRTPVNTISEWARYCCKRVCRRTYTAECGTYRGRA